MRNDYVKDERLIFEKRKAQSTGFELVILILNVSIIVQMFFMRANLEQYCVELFMLVGCGLYNTVLNYRCGIYNFKDTQRKKTVFKTVVTCGVSAVFFVLLTGDFKLNNILLFIILYLILLLTADVIVGNLVQKRQRAVEKKLDEEEKLDI